MADDYKYKNLPRAANGIAPAYWDEKEKEWLPYEGSANIVEELNNIKATQAKILERLDKPLDTQVTGSKVEELMVLDSETLIDTSLNLTTVRGLENYKKIVVFARCSVDAPVEIRLLPLQQVGYRIFNRDTKEYFQDDSVILNKDGRGNYLYNLSTRFEWLDKLSLDAILYIRYQAMEEPSEGSLSIHIMGVK